MNINKRNRMHLELDMNFTKQFLLYNSLFYKIFTAQLLQRN